MKYVVLVAAALLASCATEKTLQNTSSENCWDYIGQAIRYRENKNYPATLDELEQHRICIDKKKSKVRMTYFYHLGWTYYEMGEYDEAIAAFTQGLETQPTYLYAYWRRGLAYEKSGELSKAESDYSQAYALGMQQDAQLLLENMEKYPEIREKLMPK